MRRRFALLSSHLLALAALMVPAAAAQDPSFVAEMREISADLDGEDKWPA